MPLGNSRIVAACLKHWHEVPEQLSGLIQLQKLALYHTRGGWQHLPRQLQQLALAGCDMPQVPVELAGLTQLSKLSAFQHWH